MADYPAPYLIQFPKLGAADIGYISVGENTKDPLPFAMQRVFWTYHTPESILRGRHAHHRTEQVLIAVAGRIIVTTEQANGDIQIFRLEDPFVGLYVPPCVWHTMQYSHTAVQLALASQPYEEADYIRDFQEFRQRWSPQN
ncbi:FdtA/QdtA family cupin domain-containing protein [Hymenobacter sp. BT683]|uniref:FdtA/QdtA family cupin domain-containing protein n=1 Tax=Hymenobacter jeongseonensis TaxID=2791027 RepID=A0ABS0IEH7_9BACT|nr:FdtA/QdtA family cupin domain-containing protein [Hymenobacter jeongseonensis]MBF9236759.1 FdtA/QdtA family cupin domain-containing protein [Hymenobacter jeongseonensis]